MRSLMKNPLLDKDFLLELDNSHEKEVWARIIVLTFDERAVEEITGKITSGNLNIDGSSSLRRTCSLSMVAQDVNINDYYWGLNSKFKLEIGLTNKINPEYPEIIWFKQGIFVLTQFNTSHTVGNYNISLQGQDKMCLLNGSIGGNLTASIDFSQEEYYDVEKDMTIINKIPIKTIIKEAVHEYAKEPWQNIIVNDLDDYGIELLEYRGSTPMYMFFVADTEADSHNIMNVTLNKNHQVYLAETNEQIAVDEIENYDLRIDVDWEVDDSNYKPTLIKLTEDGPLYTVSKVEAGHTVGYRLTDITYPGDLISSVGESLTSILDKLVSMLGNFEYFYDVDGRFVFQKKKIFADTSWNTIERPYEETYVENAAYSSAAVYHFEGNNLISAFANSPQLANVKNDYSLWGTKKSVTGQELPVHYRFAIDKKPVSYTTIPVSEEEAMELNSRYGTSVKPRESKVYNAQEYDWRELIYQMALDYRQLNHWDEFIPKLIETNKDVYPTGYTGYEHYYIDMEGFWRQLYNPQNEENAETSYWNPQVFESPETLNFWIDFLDADSELAQYAVSVIGNRPKAINDNNIKSIYFRETPTVLFYGESEDFRLEERKSGYTYIQIQPNMEGLFNISSQGKSAKDVLDEQLYNHAYCVESVSISAVPIYYLEPNTRIFIRDDESNINGEYIVRTISVPLGNSGTMSLAATKAVERIY